MGNDKRRYRTEITKTVRETEAEATAFVVSKSIGLTTSTASADYISRRRRIPTAPAGAVALPGRSTAAHRYCSASSLKLTNPITGR
jgi:hypothetical protein